MSTGQALSVLLVIIVYFLSQYYLKYPRNKVVLNRDNPQN